jgi:hypothetical protein
MDIIAMLLEKGFEVNEKYCIGSSHTSFPLHVACLAGCSDLISVLLENGADINIKDHHGNTPLHLALCKDARSTSLLFLQRGANITLKNSKGKTPLHLASFATWYRLVASHIAPRLGVQKTISIIIDRFVDRLFCLMIGLCWGIACFCWGIACFRYLKRK